MDDDKKGQDLEALIEGDRSVVAYAGRVAMILALVLPIAWCESRAQDARSARESDLTELKTACLEQGGSWSLISQACLPK